METQAYPMWAAEATADGPMRVWAIVGWHYSQTAGGRWVPLGVDTTRMLTEPGLTELAGVELRITTDRRQAQAWERSR